MGNTNTQKIKAAKRSIEFNYYVDILSLQSTNLNRTIPFLKPQFMLNLSQLDKNDQKFSRQCNPICPLSMKITKNWVTCCFISPLMAIATPLYIIDSRGDFIGQCEVLAVFQGQVHNLNIKDAKMIVPNDICVIFLDKPFEKVGWLGLSYFKQDQAQKKMKSLSICHPQRVSKINHKQLFHHQEVKVKQMTVYMKQKYLFARNESHINPVILRVLDNGPQLIGLQINIHECLIFDEKIFKKIKSIAVKYIQDNIRTLQKFIDSDQLPILF